MVYESRVGDVFTLGSSSWRIEDITHDRVLVSPAPGQPGKLPFWHGDAPGRPVELGRAVGAFLREIGRLDRDEALARARATGLDDWAATNLLEYLREQRDATGHLPDDRTIVVERFRDELGDWRVAVHSPFGAPVHAPWALAVSARMRERYGVDVQAMHADDGIVLRLPEMDSPPPSDVALFAADEVETLVQDEVGGSALFASRFRECAGRALLLPRRDPGRRTPLWQQRQRAAQLLGVASRYPTFPIVLETMRECLQDVFDVPGLIGLMRDIDARRVRIVEVETPSPSPFARSLLFGYVAAFLYEGDAPLAERRAAALSIDSALLAELLGRAELRDLIDLDALLEVESETQRLTPSRRVTTLEGVADLLRVVGDLTTAEAVARGATPQWLAALEESRRALRVRIAGDERWIAIEDAGRVRDALGTALPVGVPEAFTEPVADPLGDLVARYARTHGPFVPADVASRLGLGVAVVSAALARLASQHRVVQGEFRPGGRGSEWCDSEVLRAIRRRSLAKLRHEVEPVPPRAVARFLPAWQGVATSSARGVDAVLRVVEQLQGAAVPASMLERLVLPARVADYSPAMLDELCAAGEVIWSGTGALPGNDGWIALHLEAAAPLTLTPPDDDAVATPTHRAVLDSLANGQALFFRALSDAVTRDAGPVDDATLLEALWDLVWAGHVTNDTLGPLRARLAGSRSAAGARRAVPRGRYGRPGRPPLPTRSGPPAAAGRWSRLPAVEPDMTRRARALADALLDRHGIVTRGAVVSEHVPGGYAAVYPVLRAMEESGHARRGYFVEGLGAAQFALPGAVDRLRSMARAEPTGERPTPSDDGAWATPVPGGWRDSPRKRAEPTTALVLAAADPANPYGAALGWPERPTDGSAPQHRPGRKAGALVVLVDGALVVYVERGGKSLLTFSDDEGLLQPALDALALAVRDGALGKLAVERADGDAVLGTPLAAALRAAGFHATPRGLRIRS
jgi:ATP-dependent Lhr-like helicase